MDGNRTSASLYDMIPAKPQNAKPYGEWNTGKIMVYKGTVVHYQNGENVLEYHLWTPEWQAMLDKSKFSKDKNAKAYELLTNCGGEQKEGYIGLQDHGDTCGIATSQLKSSTNYSRNRYTFCVQRDRVTDPSVVLFGGVQVA